MTGYGYQHAAFHLIKAAGLFGLFFAGLFGLLGSVLYLESSGAMTAQELSELSIVFEIAAFGLLAVFAWSFIEFAAALWSVSYVRRAASWIETKVSGVAS